MRSARGPSDPNAFAMSLIKAAMQGSTSGFDDLIADAKRMQRETEAVTPPPPCEGYHRASLEALAEGRTLLEEMKTAIERRDVAALSAMAQRASALQGRAEALAQMREEMTVAARRR